jgi:Second Messenger Oligonucleotide or Dinucleotide Synthetase domain
MTTLPSQFEEALTKITVNGAKRARAIEAHLELRAVLEADPKLRQLGIETVLIGSYARQTGIYPGRDVDVFAKLAALDTAADPQEVFSTVCQVLVDAFGDRAEPQRRSIKVSFDYDGDGFAVDAVPAVRLNERWALPNHDRDVWQDRDKRWIETDPERLAELTTVRNEEPTLSGGGAYVPTVKLVRQTREANLGDEKPGGLYFELLTYWAFEGGVDGVSQAEILAKTLRSIGAQLRSGLVVVEPALDQPYSPAPEASAVERAGDVFEALATDAEVALEADECPAAAIWRRILGANNRGACFPLPEGCDETGRVIATAATALAARGSREAGGFG